MGRTWQSVVCSLKKSAESVSDGWPPGPRLSRHYRCGGIEVTRGSARIGAKGRGRRLADFDFEALGFGIAGGVGDGQRVSGCFGGSYVDAAEIRGPDGTGLRLELDGLGVGHAVAQLDGFTAANDPGDGVETLDGEFLAAKMLQGEAILLPLLLGLRFPGAPFDVAIFLPARNEDEANHQGGDTENGPGIK